MAEREDPYGQEITEKASGLMPGQEYVVQADERWPVSTLLGLPPNQVGKQLVTIEKFSLLAGDTLLYRGRIGDLGLESEEDSEYPLFRAGAQIIARVPAAALATNFVAPDLNTCQKLRAK